MKNTLCPFTRRCRFEWPTLVLLVSILSASIASNCALAVQETDANPNKELKKTEEPKPIPSIKEKTKSLQRNAGFFSYYWDERQGKILLEVPSDSEEFLYVQSLATGLGSNPVGLDRGQLGSQKVVRFERVGPKVLLIQRNLRFRANTDNPLEQRAVQQSFAESTIWGGTVAAQDDQNYLVDISSLILSDAHDVTNKLAATDQGEFKLDPKRSAVFLPRCKSFPDNTEFEASLTFAGKKPGSHVRQTTPTPKSVTLRQHHSLVRLPDADYRPRKYDVRCPSMSITFADYASPLDAQLEKRWILRHRLQKKDPEAAISEPMEPIIYYVDSGAPKQIQEALLEGARWWDEAFEAAGFKNAFQVELLPANADPLDVRYNVIQWVHRSTRGWSYGGSVIDPRTGEIIKGHVTLGSLRVRQDQLLYNGLHPQVGNPLPNASANCFCCGVAGITEEATLSDIAGESALDVALARIRQLSAHEVGHTLGFVHNFAASTYRDRASVMDYPAPRIKITETGQLDLSDAYGVGIGDWDKIAVRFAYQQFAEDQETAGLESILKEATDAGMLFISDSDARPAGASHPLANLWDNGSDPLKEFFHVMAVRKTALSNFGKTKFLPDTTTADIAQYFVPVYLHHRFQLKAVGKLIGGQVYQYGYAPVDKKNEIVNPAIQLRAIEALVDSIRPENLSIDPEVRKLVSPRPYSMIREREMLPSRSGRVFDPLAAAQVAADLSLNELLQHERLGRLEYHARTSPELAPSYVVEKIVRSVWRNPHAVEPVEINQISQVVRSALLEKLIYLADHASAASSVRAAALRGIEAVDGLAAIPMQGPEQSFRKFQRRRIRLFLERPYKTAPDPQTPPTPPGDPIGSIQHNP